MSDQTLDLTFGSGPDDQSDPRLLPPGSVVSAFNQVYDLDGSYQPRFGYVGMGSRLTQLRRLAVFADELIAVDGAELWTWDNTEADWSPKDVAPGPGITHAPLFNTSSSFTAWNEATGNGYRVVAWIDGVDSTTLIRAAVYSIETGGMVLGPVLVSGVSRPTTNVQVAVVGTKALVAWVDVIAPVVAGSLLDLTNVAAGFGSPTTLSDASNPLIDGTYGFALWSTATTFGIAYETAPTGGTHFGTIVARNFSSTLSLLNSHATSVAAHYYGSVSISAAAVDGGFLWVVVSAYGYLTDGVSTVPTVWAMQYDAGSMIPQAGPIDTGSGHSHLGVAKTGVSITSPTQAVVAFSGAEGLFYNWITAAGPTGSLQYVPGVMQSCMPMYSPSEGLSYLFANSWTQYTGTLGQQYGSYYAVSLGTSAAPKRDLCAILAPRIVNTPSLSDSSTWSPTPRLFFSSATVMEVPLPIVRNTGRQGMDLFQGDLLAPFRWSPASLGREAYLSGQIYDSNLLSEIGFGFIPFIASAAASGSGSFTGTWQYTVTYGRINARGDLEESAPAIPVQVTASSNATFTLHVTTCPLTQKQRSAFGTSTGSPTPISLIVYRTQALANGDTLRYRVFNEPFPQALENDPTVAQIVITDTTTDASLTDGTHPILYTDSGELPHNGPETFTHICSHKNRLVGIGADQQTVWISQEYSDGTTPAWNELVTLSVDTHDEALLAVASLYDKLLIFSQTRIYVVYGDGPAISGAGNDYTTPQRIPSPSGCIDPRSVVNTPMGIMFQGIMGLMLIDPGLGVTFAGKNIVNALAPYPTCVSADWCEDSSTIRFGFSSSDAQDSTQASGVIALYDVRRQRWAVHQLTNAQIGGGTLPGGAPIAAATWHPDLGYITGYNVEFGTFAFPAREATTADPTPWLDFGLFWVPLIVTSAPIKSGSGPQGGGRFRRIRELGQFYESHGLTMTIGLDYAPPSEAHVYSSAEVLAFVQGSREQVRAIPAFGKGEAIQVTLQTTEPSPHPSVYTGRGCGFTGLSFEVHQRSGGYRNIGAGAKT